MGFFLPKARTTLGPCECNPNIEVPTMSPHAANSLVHDLVQMAQAFERLPIVEADLTEAKNKIELLLDNVQRLEIKLMEKNDRIEELHAQVRTAEASRDDAEFRFLEAEDRTASALAFVRTVFGNAGALIQALDPPREEPKANPIIHSEEVQSSLGVVGQGQEVSGELSGETKQTQLLPAEGQSEPDPTHAIEQTTSAFESSVPHSDVGSTEPPKPHAGKRYMDHPGWVSREDWLAGGGTNESYDWRDDFGSKIA
jgi:hypothetical protein